MYRECIRGAVLQLELSHTEHDLPDEILPKGVAQ